MFLRSQEGGAISAALAFLWECYIFLSCQCRAKSLSRFTCALTSFVSIRLFCSVTVTMVSWPPHSSKVRWPRQAYRSLWRKPRRRSALRPIEYTTQRKRKCFVFLITEKMMILCQFVHRTIVAPNRGYNLNLFSRWKYRFQCKTYIECERSGATCLFGSKVLIIAPVTDASYTTRTCVSALSSNSIQYKYQREVNRNYKLKVASNRYQKYTNPLWWYACSIGRNQLSSSASKAGTYSGLEMQWNAGSLC